MALIHMDTEEYEKAAELLKKALSINKQYGLTLVTMGNLLFETGNSEDSLRYFKHALAINDKEL